MKKKKNGKDSRLQQHDDVPFEKFHKRSKKTFIEGGNESFEKTTRHDPLIDSRVSRSEKLNECTRNPWISRWKHFHPSLPVHFQVKETERTVRSAKPQPRRSRPAFVQSDSFSRKNKPDWPKYTVLHLPLLSFSFINFEFLFIHLLEKY